MKTMSTLRARLTMTYTAIAMGLMLALGAGLYLSLWHELNHAADMELRDHADGIAQMLRQKQSSGETADIPDELQELAGVDARAEPIRVSDGQGNVLFQSAGADELFARVHNERQFSEERRFGDAHVHRRAFRTLRIEVNAGPHYVLETAADRTEYDEALERLRTFLLLGIPVALCLSFGAGYWMSGRALRPIHLITETVREIDDRRLTVRLPMRGVDDELEQLAKTLNGMLDRLEDGFARVRRFTADASHELRTPLALVRGNAEVMRVEAELAPSTEARRQEILAESDRMLVLIQSLLEMARSDEGMMSGAELIDPADLTRRIAEVGRKLAEESEVEFTVEGPKAIFPLRGNDLALGRALVILLDNAFHYTPPGKQVRLVVRSSAAECTMEVADSGCGIEAVHLPRIFDRFYRVDEDRNRATGGMGLGLAIAKTIVDAHRGKITVESTRGVGTSFVLTLPNQAS